MMLNLFFIALSVILIVFGIIDIVIYKRNKVKRTRTGFVILISMLGLAGLIAYVGITGHLQSQAQNNSNKYMAVKHLANGNIELAMQYIQIMPDATDDERYSKYLLHVIAEGKQGNYEVAIEKSGLVMSTSQLTGSQLKQMNELVTISHSILDLQADSEQYEETNTEVSAAFDQAVTTAFEQFHISDQIRVTYDAIYSIDRAVAEHSFTSEAESMAVRLLDIKSEDAFQAATKFYFAKGDLETAENTARLMVEKYPTTHNKIIYTDVIAQGVRDSLTRQDYSRIALDEESSKYVLKAEELEGKAAGYQDLLNKASNDKIKEKYIAEQSKLSNEALEYKKRALLVPVMRSINYLSNSTSIVGDRTGLVNMQIAKLYFVADEIEQSNKYVQKVVTSTAITSDSIIKNDINTINEALKSNGSTIPPESQFVSSVDQIINKMSRNVVPSTNSTINQEFKNSVVAELRYSNLHLFISNVDYSAYPQISAKVNINGEKNGMFGLVNHFEADDFNVTDTNYKIQDFKFSKNTNDGTSIAMVLDGSGSMLGRPYEDAKLAILACLDNLGSKDVMSIVTYSDAASIESGLSGNAEIVKNKVQSLNNPDGGTNISDGLLKGIDTLQSASGVKAIILMSDGQDNVSEEGSLEKIIASAQQQGISIFTVGLGDVDQSYLTYVAEQTGGVFLRADNTTALYQIYNTLQRYIINNYTFDYTVSKNAEVNIRQSSILLVSEGLADSKYYHVGGGEIPEDEAAYDAMYQDPNSLFIEQITPSKLAVSQIAKDTKIKITGKNFDAQMKVIIGNYYSDSVKVSSPTEAEFTLPEALVPGMYSLTLENPNGNRKTREMAFTLYKPGVATKLKIGLITIEANTIGQIDSTTFAASGDVVINGLLRSSGDISISANAPNNLDFSQDEVINLGPSGTISGNGKLFVSYSKEKEDGSRNTFAAIALSGRDFVVKDGEFRIHSSAVEASFENNTLSFFKFKLPGVIDVEAGSVTIKPDGIEVKANIGDSIGVLDKLSGNEGERSG